MNFSNALLERCEQILLEGLAIGQVRDRTDIAERIADLYEEQGRSEKLEEFRELARKTAATMQTSLDIGSGSKVLQQKTTFTFGNEGLPLSELSKIANQMRTSAPQHNIGTHKIGRNEPCPCGSGKRSSRMLRRPINGVMP